jgi:hypothetical protein
MLRLFDFDIELEASPRIWRRFLLEHKSSFADLHDAIQIATGWRDTHLHAFTDDEGDEEASGYVGQRVWGLATAATTSANAGDVRRASSLSAHAYRLQV